MNQQRLLVHVGDGDPDTIRSGLRTARNARAVLPLLLVEIVVHGPVVAVLAAGSAVGPDLDELQDDSVQVLACLNSLRSAGLAADQLHARVTTVPAAVAHLAMRQFDGWAYVRV